MDMDEAESETGGTEVTTAFLEQWRHVVEGLDDACKFGLAIREYENVITRLEHSFPEKRVHVHWESSEAVERDDVTITMWSVAEDGQLTASMGCGCGCCGCGCGISTRASAA